MAKKFKTNALRMLDKAKIAYSIKEYEYDEDHLDGRHVASQVDMVPEAIFKTLVLHDNHNEYLVCCVPVLEEIDLKKLAKLAGRKNVEMIFIIFIFLYRISNLCFIQHSKRICFKLLSHDLHL